MFAFCYLKLGSDGGSSHLEQLTERATSKLNRQKQNMFLSLKLNHKCNQIGMFMHNGSSSSVAEQTAVNR